MPSERVGYPGATEALRANWDPAKHPRRPKGIEGGGQFGPSWGGVVPRKLAEAPKPPPRNKAADEAVVAVDDFLHGKGPEPSAEQVELVVTAFHLADEQATALRTAVDRLRKPKPVKKGRLGSAGKVSKSGYQLTLEMFEREGKLTPQMAADLAKMRRSDLIPIGLSATPADRELARRLQQRADWKPDLHPRDPHGKFAHSWQGAFKKPPGQRADAAVDGFLAQHGTTRAQLQANTQKLLDSATPEQRSGGVGWYRASGKESARIGAKYRLDPATAIAVVAAMSPRCAWDGDRPEEERLARGDGNLGLAQKLMAAAADPPDTPIRIPDAAFTKARKGLGSDRNAFLPESRRAKLVDNPNLTYGDLTPAELGVFHPGVTGTILPANKARAMLIAKGADPNDILGGLKVRSFFDNLADPDHSDEVTIDSHQIRAMVGDIGLPDSVYSALAGNPSRYQALADVVRKVAAENGLKPHQVQAITWEVWKGRYDIGDRRLANPDNAKRSTDLDVVAGPQIDYDALPDAQAREMEQAGSDVVELVRQATGYTERANWNPELHPRLPGGHHGGGQFGHNVNLNDTAVQPELPGKTNSSNSSLGHPGADYVVSTDRYPRQVGTTAFDAPIAEVMNQLTQRFPGVDPPMVVIHPKTQQAFDRLHASGITTGDTHDPKAVAALQNAGLAPNTIFLRPDILLDRQKLHETWQRAIESKGLVVTKSGGDAPPTGDQPNFALTEDQLVQGLVIHEFGHYLGNALSHQAKVEAQRKLFDAVETDRQGNPDNPAGWIAVHDQISPYATKSAGEAMAEAFSQAWLKQQHPAIEQTGWATDVWSTFDKAFGPKEAHRDSHPRQPDLGRAGEAVSAGAEAARRAGHHNNGHSSGHFDPARHPRGPKGSGHGGQFVHTPGPAEAAPSPRPSAKEGVAPARYPKEVGTTAFDPTVASTMGALADRYGLKPPVRVGDENNPPSEIGSWDDVYAYTEVPDPPYPITVSPAFADRPMTEASAKDAQTPRQHDETTFYNLGFGWVHPPGDAGEAFTRYTLEHEYGHALTVEMLHRLDTRPDDQQRLLGRLDPFVQATQTKPVFDEGSMSITNAPVDPAAYIDMVKTLGVYATSSHLEAVAEAFARGRAAERGEVAPNPYSDIVMATFDEVFPSKAKVQAADADFEARLKANNYDYAKTMAGRADWNPDLHPRIPHGHGGGEFAHLPGAGSVLDRPADHPAPSAPGRYDGLEGDTVFADAITQATTDLAAKYPKAPKPRIVVDPKSNEFFGHIGDGSAFAITVGMPRNDHQRDVLAATEKRYGIQQDTIYLNPRLFQSRDRMLVSGYEVVRTKRTGMAALLDPDNPDPEQMARYTIDHEYGHFLQNHLSNNDATLVEREFTDALAVDPDSEAGMGLYLHPEEYSRINDDLSLYATANPHEALAEAFAQAQLSDPERWPLTDYAVNVGGFMDRHYGPQAGPALPGWATATGNGPIDRLQGTWDRKVGTGLSDTAYREAVQNGGVTIDTHGNEPHSGYAVALSKGTERKVDLAHFTPAVVADYMAEHKHELTQPGAHLGIWEQDGQMYLDISYVGPPSKETLVKAQKAQQLAVFDLATMEEIPTGTMKGGRYEPTALDRSVGRPPPGRFPEDAGGAARRADGGGRDVPRQDSRTRVGFPGATEALRKAGVSAPGHHPFNPKLHPHAPKGSPGHSGGRFVKKDTSGGKGPSATDPYLGNTTAGPGPKAAITLAHKPPCASCPESLAAHHGDIDVNALYALLEGVDVADIPALELPSNRTPSADPQTEYELGRWRGPLPRAQQKALLDYSDHTTGRYNDVFNMPLRRGEAAGPEVRTLEQAFKPTDRDIALRRDIWNEKVTQQLADMQPGDIFADKAFSSTHIGASDSTPQAGVAHLHILAPHGTLGLYLGQASAFPDEDELLLYPGQPLVLLQKDADGSNFYLMAVPKGAIGGLEAAGVTTGDVVNPAEGTGRAVREDRPCRPAAGDAPTTRVGFPGATEVLRKAGVHWTPDLHPRILHGHGGGEFAKKETGSAGAAPLASTAPHEGRAPVDVANDTLGRLVADYAVERPPMKLSDRLRRTTTAAQTGTSYPYRIELNPSVFGDQATLQRAGEVSYLRPDRHFVVFDQLLDKNLHDVVAGTVTHEFAHALAAQLKEDDPKVYRELMKPYRHALVRDRATGSPKRPDEADRLEHDLGVYAWSDPEEAMAEAFVQGRLAKEGRLPHTEWGDHALAVFDRQYGRSNVAAAPPADVPHEEITTPGLLRPGDRLKIPFGPGMNKIGVVEKVDHEPENMVSILYRFPDASRPAIIRMPSDFLVSKTGHGDPLPPPPKPWTPSGAGQSKAEHLGRAHKIDALRKEIGPPDEIGKRWETFVEEPVVTSMKQHLAELKDQQTALLAAEQADPLIPGIRQTLKHLDSVIRKAQRDIALFQPDPPPISGRMLVSDMFPDGGPGPATLAKVEKIKQAGALLRHAITATLEQDPAMKEKADLEKRKGEIDARRVEVVHEKYTREQKDRDELAQRYGYKNEADLQTAFDRGELVRASTPYIEMRNLKEQQYGRPMPSEYLRLGFEGNDVGDRLFELEGTLAQHRRDVARAMVAGYRGDMGGNLQYRRSEEGWPSDTRAMSALGHAVDVYPSAWVQKVRPMYTGIDSRGYHKNGAGEIMLSSADEIPGDVNFTRVGIHELAHEMEDVVPGLRQAEWAFWWSRATKESPGHRRMPKSKEMDGMPGEVAVPDNFQNAYSGKVYGDGGVPSYSSSWELFSTGMESLMDRGAYLNGLGTPAQPVNPTWADTDYVDFTLGLLATL